MKALSDAPICRAAASIKSMATFGYWAPAMDNAHTGTQKPKRPDVGLRQARRLCQLPERKRLPFIAEGLPVILDSADGFWMAAQQLTEHHREAKVLKCFAEEEAAKVLILMDVARCPRKLVASKLSKMIGWFYDHLAPLIYAEAVVWKPMDLAQLRDYVDQQRRGHYVDGYAGEFIMPNSAVYERESRLYADVEAYQDGTLAWTTQRDAYRTPCALETFQPPALRLAKAMQNLGLFTKQGLQATSDIWGSLEFGDKENHHDGEHLIEQLLKRVHAEGLFGNAAQQSDVATLYNDWQIPMYNLDLSLIPITLDQLKAEQERQYWSMVGDP